MWNIKIQQQYNMHHYSAKKYYYKLNHSHTTCQKLLPCHRKIYDAKRCSKPKAKRHWKFSYVSYGKRFSYCSLIKYAYSITRLTKCSLQSSSATIGGQFRLEIAPRSLFPAFATISGSISILSVYPPPPNTPTAVCIVLWTQIWSILSQKTTYRI